MLRYAGPLLALAANVCAAELELARDGRSPYVIVVAAGADAPTRTAAKELREHLQAVTGADLPVVTDDAAPANQPLILVGTSARLTAVAPDLKLDELGPDGIAIRTVGQHLVLAGRPPRGNLYAVTTFLEDTVGCRWWTSTESFAPRRPTLTIPPLDHRYTPSMRYREAFYRDAFQGVFASRLKCNGHFAQTPPEYGGHYRILGWCHTFFQLLPPDKYFAAHPDWYSEIGGQRKAEATQLCLTNEAMRAELVQQALAWIRKEPAAGMISISQNDWAGRCECARCRAVEAAEGSPSGPLLRFVNAVAEAIEQEYPDFLIETLAYHYTRQPPKLVKPRRNVVVRLCSIECSYVQPLATGAQNEQFRRDVEGWSAVAPHLYVWDYVTNFANYLLPHPNLRVLAPNVRYFAEHRCLGLFEQGDASSTIGDFVRLRAWLLAHLMWDPSRDERALVTEFLRGYYGAAAAPLQQYLDLIHDAAERSGVYLRCYMTDTAAWLDLETLTRATTLFAQAEQAVAGDPVLSPRVRRERLPLDLVWLQRYQALKRQAKRAGVPFTGPADPVALCDEYLRLAEQHGNGSYGEGRPFGPFGAALKGRFAPSGPPPEPARGLSDDDWVDAQEGSLTLHGLGHWVTLVDDPQASNQKAARMPGNHPQWAVQWPFPGDLDDGSKWQVYALARCEATTDTGKAFGLGVYDGPAGKGLANLTVDVPQAVGETYRLFDLGMHRLTAGTYAWVAPAQRPEVTAVYVDRIFVVRR